MATSSILKIRSTESAPIPVSWYATTVRFLSPRSTAGVGTCAVPGCAGLSYAVISTGAGRRQTCFTHFEKVCETTGLRR